MGVSLSRLRSEIERQVTRGDGKLRQDMQLTPRAKRVIDLAYDQARLLRNNYIGAEHLLLGLIAENDSLAARILQELGATLERARTEVQLLQDNDSKLNPPRAVQGMAGKVKSDIHDLRFATETKRHPSGAPALARNNRQT